MNVMPLFSTPVCYDEYELDKYEVELIKKETFHDGLPHDGSFTNDHSILLKYPNLSNVVHTHIKSSLYDANSLHIMRDIKYKITSSWVNKLVKSSLTQLNVRIKKQSMYGKHTNKQQKIVKAMSHL